MSTTDIRHAVLKVRASKGMLEDSHRYLTEAMRGTKKSELVAIAHNAQRTQAGNDEPDYNRHSCGSFFMNPILSEEQAARPDFPKTRLDSVRPCRMAHQESKHPQHGLSIMQASIKATKPAKTLLRGCPPCIRWH